MTAIATSAPQMLYPAPAAASVPQAGAPSSNSPSSDSPSSDSPFSFHALLHDLFEVANPLQHIPVISTLYRAITGDKIGIPEKLAGDFLYGGPLGLVGSLADTAFQEVTGKDVGDTVLAFLTGGDKTAVASAAGQPAQLAPAQVTPAQATPLSALGMTPDVAALWQALSQKGVDQATASRAVGAYSKTLGLPLPQPGN
jgi:hypothetical protein